MAAASPWTARSTRATWPATPSMPCCWTWTTSRAGSWPGWRRKFRRPARPIAAHGYGAAVRGRWGGCIEIQPRLCPSLLQHLEQAALDIAGARDETRPVQLAG